MRKLTWARENYFSKDTYHLLLEDKLMGIEVWGDATHAIAFHGKANKPDWHYRFADEAKRDVKINDWFQGWKEAAERKQAQRTEKAAWCHDVKVGDIFRCSWGYDQTNIDYYEVVAVHGKAVDVLEIGAMSEDTAWLQGNSVPAPGHYINDRCRNEHGEIVETPRKPRRMIPQKGYNGEPYLSINSFSSASRMKPVEVAGIKCYEASHWTAYA